MVLHGNLPFPWVRASADQTLLFLFKRNLFSLLCSLGSSLCERWRKITTAKTSIFCSGHKDQGFTSLLILLQSTGIQQEIIPLPTSFRTQSTPIDNTEGEKGWEGEGREGTSLGLRMASATTPVTLPHQDVFKYIYIGCEWHQWSQQWSQQTPLESASNWGWLKGQVICKQIHINHINSYKPAGAAMVDDGQPWPAPLPWHRSRATTTAGQAMAPCQSPVWEWPLPHQ